MGNVGKPVSTTKEPCVCWQLHLQCDPATCSETTNLHAKPESRERPHLWTELDFAAESRCPTYQAIRSGIDAVGGLLAKDDHTELTDNIEIFNRSHGQLDTLYIRLHGNEYEFIQNSPSGCKAFPIGEFESCSTRMPSVFEQCKKWIKECVESHDICQVENSALPFRVVDIGWIEGEKFSPRLHESENEIGGYAALSHCWGSIPIMKTTTTTIPQLKQSIPWFKLSKTFQEAIFVTHELGLRYIWIDCLCIIQDDTFDWERQSKEMATIYGNSRITIAAAKAKDGNGGCFNDADDNIVSFKHPVSGTSMAIRKYDNHELYGHSNRNAKTRPGLPLFARAWTLQEELLAPRVLYYGPIEVVFQCRKLVVYQCGKVLCGEKLIYHGAETVKRLYETSRRKSDSCYTLQNWLRISSQYSSRRLTFETDRLPALSGLSKSFMKFNLGAFVAGLWEKDLHLSLTWHSVEPKQSRANAYVAPSWSWASTGSDIEYIICNSGAFGDPKYHQSHLEILDVACEPSGLDPTGAVRAGYLRIRGRANSAQLRWNSTVQEGSFIQFGTWAMAVKLDYIPQRLDPDPDFSTLAVNCLLLCSAFEDSYILVLIPQERTGFYERCGIGSGNALTRANDWKVSGMNRPELMIDKQESSIDGAAEFLIKDWFKDVEEQEMTIV